MSPITKVDRVMTRTSILMCRVFGRPRAMGTSTSSYPYVLHRASGRSFQQKPMTHMPRDASARIALVTPCGIAAQPGQVNLTMVNSVQTIFNR